MNLASDEILAEILPAARLVAVTALVDEAGTSNAVGRVAKTVPRFPKVDIERLIALKPDLVVVSEYTDADVLRALQSVHPQSCTASRIRTAPGESHAHCPEPRGDAGHRAP